MAYISFWLYWQLAASGSAQTVSHAWQGATVHDALGGIEGGAVIKFLDSSLIAVCVNS